MLYAGKTSGILVSLIFLPIYSKALGSEVFGLVAVILSLQTLLIMLDLGMSTLVGRDIAAAVSGPTDEAELVASGERVLSLTYGLLFTFASLTALAGLEIGSSSLNLPLIVILFFFVVLQNFHYSVIVARRHYTVASLLQVVGNLVRAGFTVWVITRVSATLTAFVISQLAVAAAHLFLSRKLSLRQSCGSVEQMSPPGHRGYRQCARSAIAMLKRAWPIAVMSVAGAAVMQLDKPLISFFMGPASVAPYFLAVTYCMTPLAVFASPVAQYFQPLVVSAISRDDRRLTGRLLRSFAAILLTATLVPSLVLYVFSDVLVGWWLNDSPLAQTTEEYVKVLLPGVVIGALGYVPYTLLLASREYRFMGRMSVVMTSVTLVAVVLLAYAQSVWFICAVYALYHTTSTVVQCIRISSNQDYAGIATGLAVVAIALIILFLAVGSWVGQA